MPVDMILPDTDTSKVKKVIEILFSGQTHVEAMDDKESVTNLAECLSISMQNLSLHVTGGPGTGKIKLRNMSEVLMPGFNFNDNSNKTTIGEDEDLLETEDNLDGVVEKGQDEPNFIIEGQPRLSSSLTASSNLPEESHPQKSLCSNCRNNPCLHGSLLNNVEANYEGINVELVVQTSEKIYGQVEKQYRSLETLQVKTLVVKWVNREKSQHLNFQKDGKFKFKYFCNKYTELIKSALKYLEKTKRRKKKQYPLDKILEVLKANAKVRKIKTNKNHVDEALKKMVASKELIECPKKKKNKKNSPPYYKLSDS